MKQNILFATLLFIIIACRQKSESTQTQTDSVQDTLEFEENEPEPVKELFEKLDDDVVAVIKNYYEKDYSKDTRLETEIRDNTLKMTYWSIPNEENYHYDGYIISAYIPLTKKVNRFGDTVIVALDGDLNNDQRDDLIVTVYTEQGNSGGMDLFLFINDGEKYNLINEGSTSQLGSFFGGGSSIESLIKIENQLLVVNSYAYGAKDARCCPSIKYIEKYALENKQLVLKQQTKTESEDNNS